MTMGQRIAERRKRLGISQEGLGEKLDVSRQAVSKWESDGAIPDVDKLIVMSKLFGVSVGWLLGVEEESAPVKEEELTEKQLRMIEEIVKRYRPEQTVVTQTVVKREGRGFRGLTALGIAAAVILAATALNKIQHMPDYGNQLAVISQNYNNVQYQLGELSGQLEELARGGRLLTEYTCTASGFEDFSGAEIVFRATPRQWQEGDAGILAVRLGEKEVAQTECTFTGSSCEAKLELPPANGYSYCFIQLHADGSREQQILEEVDHYCVYVEKGLRINCQADISWHEDANRISNGTNIYPDLFQCYLSPPTIVLTQPNLTWEYAQLIFFLNGQELTRYDVLSQENMYMEPAVNGCFLETAFWIDDFVIPMDGEDKVSAVLEAKLSNGLEISRQVKAWVWTGNYIMEEAPLDSIQ